jgi:pimeloyl-ACP methyl ester carboxylesterase
MTGKFIYLHGFASSPNSNKAKAFKKKFEKNGLDLIIPELENGDFKRMTLSSQMEVVEYYLDSPGNESCALIGSSMGGYLAALAGQCRSDIKALYLMAPAFEFLRRWSVRIEEPSSSGKTIPSSILVYHYGCDKDIQFETKIFEDAKKWEQIRFARNLPTRIAHGVNDESVPIEVSQRFVETCPWVELEKLDTDHGLGSHVDWLTEDCLSFFRRLNLW